MRLIDTETAAFMLSCSTRHIQQLVSRGILRDHSEKRNTIQISLDEISRAIENGKIRPNPKKAPRLRV